MAEWMEKYSGLKARFQEKRAQGLVFNDDDVRFLRESLNSLKLDLQILSTSPEGPSKPPASEIARREVLLTNINSHLKKVVEEQHVSRNGSHLDMASQVAGQSRPFGVPSPWGTPTRASHNGSHDGGDGGGGGYKPVATSDKGLSMRVMEMHSMQGGVLSDIDHGVTRLHDQAMAMGDEAQLHERLLDNMESNVDFAIDELKEQRERTEQLRESVAYTKLYIILVVEIIILVFLLMCML
jgi:hypothetical protein